jgi:hypothetical protein
MLKCFDTYLEQKLWTNGECSGPPANTTNVTLNVCMRSSAGDYFENLCCNKSDLKPGKRCDGPDTIALDPFKQSRNATTAGNRWIH